MRVFPRINYRGLGARGRRRLRLPRGLRSGLTRLPPETLLLVVPPALLGAGWLAYAYRADAVAVFAVAVAGALFAAAQGAALAYVARREPLRLSARTGDDRRFLLDLSGGVRAAANVEQLYEQVAVKIAREFRVECVSLFIRDDASGEFVCRARCGAGQAGGGRDGAGQDAAAHPPRLGGGAFVVRRLRNLGLPLAVDPQGFDLWVRAAPAAARQARGREAEVLRRLGARLLVQIKTRERLTGILVLGRRAAERAYSTEEKLLLLSVAGQLALVVENSKLLERMVEEERLRRELAMAAEVQRRLFPERPPRSEAIELAGYCRPARQIGGDYYDFLAFGGGQTGVVVADVAGKGISAALLMSTLQACLRSQVAGGHPDASRAGALADLVSTLNRLLCRSTGPASYVTFFYAQFDERTSLLSYVNAGHNPPLLVRAGCAGERLERGGAVLGLFESCRYDEGAVALRSGDVFVGYTDGVVEALSVGGEEFGEGRLRECVASSSHLSAEVICDGVIARLDDWCADTPQHDDLTLVVLKMR
ncbi:MAG TPA: SpoIIE family protein phosphatase [Pyrinomonadaceae bacterium]|jgi:sigma-B regulation protein RsbU (phosphoserine phosphatase)|nr:SpoIIE family protein phosphatase [Pyrinomonadaceae bacterium]